MNAIKAISAYNKVGIESSTTSADPHKLISMLFQGALLAIANAKNQMLRKDTLAKGKSISHAISIIGEGLHASLDTSVEGQLVQDLSALYDYIVRRLIEANLENFAIYFRDAGIDIKSFFSTMGDGQELKGVVSVVEWPKVISMLAKTYCTIMSMPDYEVYTDSFWEKFYLDFFQIQ